MRYFSPVYMKTCEIQAISKGIRSRLSPVSVHVEYHGFLHFTPVKVSNVLKKSFESKFIGSRTPLFDIMHALKDCEFPYVFRGDGEFDMMVPKAEMKSFTTEYEAYIADILASRSLQDGDILLCSSRYPLRGEALESALRLA